MTNQIPPCIKTERLILNSLSENDLSSFSRLQTDPIVREFLGGVVPSENIGSKFDQFLEATPPVHHFAVRSGENELNGIVSLGPHHDGKYMELSFQMLREFWGKGFAFEASEAVLDFSQNALGLKEIIAETQSKNVSSKRLLEKLGFVFRERLVRFGKDQSVYSKQLGGQRG